ncbi:MAG: two-component regulator propeller domain-containing protein, partial [Chitinophagaceae bacterium]
MLNRLTFISLLTLWLPLIAAAQFPLQYSRLTAEDGLSNNSVQCILQDKRGIMWIGTNGGLNRYDGSAFIQYSILSQPALTNSVVTALMEDEKGNIWIGTENGLNILDPVANTIRRFIHQNGTAATLPQGPVRVIQKMKDGHVWIMSDRDIARFNSDDFSPIHIDSALMQIDMVLTGVTEYSDNKLWLSYLDHATVLANRTNAPGKQERLSDPVLYVPDYAKMYTDPNNITWGISCYGISRYNSNNRSFEGWLKNNYAVTGPNLHLHTCYSIDADGNIWQGNDRTSLVKYDLAERKVTDYSWVIRATNATLVYCIYRDNNNNIWAGTDNGIIKISNRAAVFNNLSFSLNGYELKNIRCRRIATDRNNTLYAATENYGLLKKMKTSRGTDTTIALSTFGAVPISNLLFKKGTLSIKLNGKYDIG